MTPTKRSYGWKPELPDFRDHDLFIMEAPAILPTKVDSRPQMPPVYDQGQLGSCTANAIAAVVDFERMRQGEKLIYPSRLFIYYTQKVNPDDDGVIA